MAVYKIPQDVEADDKFVGPLSFKQFIFVGIAVVSCYLSFLSLTKGFWPALIFFAPIILATGFLGFPWGRDQPTEIWLAARIRFFIKPRQRIWNQAGIKDLVTITAPKHIEKHYTNGLSQNEVSSRLTGLADLLDSRGWAVKNVSSDSYNSFDANTPANDDRLVTVAAMPQEVSEVTTREDVLDEATSPTAQHFDDMIRSSEDKHRQQVLAQLQAARETPSALQAQVSAPAPPIAPVAPQPKAAADFWFLQQGSHGQQHQSGNQILDEIQSPTHVPEQQAGFATFQSPNLVAPHGTAAAPVTEETLMANVSSQDEQALLQKIHKDHDAQGSAYSHVKTIQPLGDQPVQNPVLQPPAVAPPSNPIQPYSYTPPAPVVSVTAPVDPAILKLANNDDLNVATLARQAEKDKGDHPLDDEVVVSLR